MPVLRGQTKVTALTDDRRNELVGKLRNELLGKSGLNGEAVFEAPLVFEIPLELSDRKDILVVWQAFDNVRAEDRTAIIMEAYQGQGLKIAQELGVTLEEALDQGLLSYCVVPRATPDEADGNEIVAAMRREGAVPIGSELHLYFPNLEMANEATGRLFERVPKGRWEVRNAIH